jgi:hypothetical protein
MLSIAIYRIIKLFILLFSFIFTLCYVLFTLEMRQGQAFYIIAETAIDAA